MKISQVALAVSMAGISAVATANTERDLDSHEHGAAVLNVALDVGAVFMELETPWNNLVGFEHNPSTDEQKAQVAEAMKILVEQPTSMMTMKRITTTSMMTSITTMHITMMTSIMTMTLTMMKTNIMTMITTSTKANPIAARWSLIATPVATLAT